MGVLDELYSAAHAKTLGHVVAISLSFGGSRDKI